MLRTYSLLFWILVFTLSATNSFAQNNRQVLTFQTNSLNQIQAIQVQEDAPFIAASLVWFTDDLPGQPLLRSRSESGNWSEWISLDPDPHATFDAPKYISSLFYLPAGTSEIELQHQGNASTFYAADLHLFNPGKTGPSTANDPIVSPRMCPCPQPDYEGRLDWCPSGNCPQDSTPEPTDVTHIIVHHSAGVNSSSDWAAVVRSIWDYHVNSNGWDDVGYNWLVDPNGVIYEGRGDGLQGAHFCGQNGNTVGICVMGNFTNVAPSNGALSGLRKFLGWQTCELGVDPTDFGFHDGSGLSLFYISGHKDGCATACPGDMFHPEFDALRNSVKDFIDAGCEEIAAPIDLSAMALSNTSVQLDWTETLDAGTGYEIERSPDSPTAFQWIGSVNSSTLDFIDANLSPGNYYYRVRGFGSQGNGNYSNEAFVSTIGVATSEIWNPAFVLLSPMPFGESLQIQLSDSYQGKITIDLLSIDGRVVTELGQYQKEHQDLVESWQIPELSSGLYFIRLQTTDQVLLLKTIKQ